MNVVTGIRVRARAALVGGAAILTFLCFDSPSVLGRTANRAASTARRSGHQDSSAPLAPGRKQDDGTPEGGP